MNVAVNKLSGFSPPPSASQQTNSRAVFKLVFTIKYFYCTTLESRLVFPNSVLTRLCLGLSA